MKFKLIDFKLSANILVLLSQLTIVAYYIPYFVLGENAHILIHDNLDSNVAWVKILADNNAMFAHPLKIIPSIFGGLPVYNVYGTYNIALLIFNVLGIFYGYVINKLIISIIGFWGMYFLLKRHFSYHLNSPLILIGTSLIFSLLPFWSFSATVLGLPFVLFAFLNLRNNIVSISNWLIIIIFAFYSSLILSGVFILFTLSTLFLYDTLVSRKINWSFFLGLVLLSTAYLISHYPLFYGTLFNDSQSHRLEFYSSEIGFKRAVSSFWEIFTKGQYHARSLHKYIFFPTVLVLLVWHKKFSRRIKIIVVFIILTSIFYGFQNHSLIKPVIDSLKSIIPIHLQRFHFLHPMFWYILFATTLSWIAAKSKYGQVFVTLLLVFQLSYVFKYHECWVNRYKPSFKEFYSEATFTKIKNIINKPIDDYKVISVGIHPAVAQYNGFFTLDGYIPSYPLKYKHEFRRVIENELARDEKIKTYFDNWGSRCYAFSTEIGRDYISNKKKPIDSLKYDFQHLKSMGGAYIFSAYPINEIVNPELKLIEVANTPIDYWNIYLYEINTTQHNTLHN
jgi:hypothetical protein